MEFMGKSRVSQIASMMLATGLLLTGCGGKQPTVAIPGDSYGGGNPYGSTTNQPHGTVTGRVVDAKSGLGIADVLIEVQGVSPPVTTRTDGSGNFTVANVPAMRIKLLLQKTGYTYLQSNGDIVVQVLPGNTITAPDIKLTAQLDAMPNAFILSIGNLDHPRALAIDPGNPEDGNRQQSVYVLNKENYQLFGNIQTPLRVWGVRKFNLAGGLENHFGGNFLVNELQNPTGIGVDRGGDVYVADPGNNLVRSYSAYGSLIKAPDNDKSFNGISKPYDIQVMKTGQFAIASAGNNQIMFFDAAKNAAKDGNGGSIKPITGSTGLKGLAADADDNVYFIDDTAPAGGVIKKVNSKGQILLQFGFRGGRGAGYFENPADLAVDNRNGDIYVVDSGNNRVQRFNRDGAFMSEFGGMGAGNGQFNTPAGIAIDRDGYVFISDTNNNRIQKFAPSRLVQPGF